MIYSLLKLFGNEIFLYLMIILNVILPNFIFTHVICIIIYIAATVVYVVNNIMYNYEVMVY